jgi:branched-chain amino acid transport system substrate-binding protein
MNTRPKNRLQWVFIAIAALLMVVFGCTPTDPVKIGFSGELTGRNADLGVQGRNGAILAVEALNQTGGINSKPVGLIIRDDNGTMKGAQAADKALIDAGVVAIVGHMTSGQSVAGLAVTEKAGMLMLSPTTSTSRLTGLDDLFLRVQPAITAAAEGLARLACSRYRAQRMAIIADQDNRAYSQAFQTAFVDAFGRCGGDVAAIVPFSSSAHPDFNVVLAPVLRSHANGLLMVASAQDTAFIAQHARMNGFSRPLFSSGWAQTPALIHNGGQAVEGLVMVADYDTDSPSPAFQAFSRQYRKRFGRDPTFAAAQAYEAVMVLAAGLKQTGGMARGLKQALLNIREFDGLVGRITMDADGDVVRTQFIVTIRNGAFQTLSAVDS